MIYFKIRYWCFVLPYGVNSLMTVCVYIQGNDFGWVDVVELALLDFKMRT